MAHRVPNVTGASAPRGVKQELPLAQSSDDVADGLDICVTTGGAHALEQPVLVSFGLQASDHPGAGVRYRLVIEIYRVLRAQHHPDSEGTSPV